MLSTIASNRLRFLKIFVESNERSFKLCNCFAPFSNLFGYLLVHVLVFLCAKYVHDLFIELFIVFALLLSVLRLCPNQTTSFSGLALTIAPTIFATSFVADGLWPPLMRFLFNRSSILTTSTFTYFTQIQTFLCLTSHLKEQCHTVCTPAAHNKKHIGNCRKLFGPHKPPLFQS